MIDPLKAFLQPTALTAPAFAPGSRYHGLDIAAVDAAGRPAGALRPPPLRAAARGLRHHWRAPGRRRATGSTTSPHRYIGDPQRYWQICDANGAIRPEELTETVGRRIRLTLPEGVPGWRWVSSAVHMTLMIGPVDPGAGAASS